MSREGRLSFGASRFEGYFGRFGKTKSEKGEKDDSPLGASKPPLWTSTRLEIKLPLAEQQTFEQLNSVHASTPQLVIFMPCAEDNSDHRHYCQTI